MILEIEQLQRSDLSSELEAIWRLGNFRGRNHQKLQRIDLLSEFLDKNSIFFARVDGETIGYLEGSLVDGENIPMLGRVYVESQYRRGNIGIELVQAYEQLAETNHPSVRARCHGDAIKALYEKLDYNHEGSFAGVLHLFNRNL